MSEELTNTDSAAAGGVNNDESVTGADAQQNATDNSTGTEGKTFTQADLDRVIKARLAEEGKKWASKLDEAKKAGATEAQATIEQTVSERLNAKLAEIELQRARADIAKELGLTDDQVARLKGDKPEDLRKDADTIYGALKKPTPPIIRGGTKPNGPLDANSVSPEDAMTNFAALIQATQK